MRKKNPYHPHKSKCLRPKQRTVYKPPSKEEDEVVKWAKMIRGEEEA